MSSADKSRTGQARLVRVASAVAAAVALPAMMAGPAVASTQSTAGTLTAAAEHPVSSVSLANRAGTAAPSRTSVPTPHAAAVAAARARAVATGRPVVIAADTSAISITTANPDGTFTDTLSALPSRVFQHGRWVPVSAQLIRTATGRYHPAASAEPLSLSAGGAGPLAVLQAGATTLSVWFPAALRAPVVHGATATYRAVRPGIDLDVTASAQGGITERLVVRTAQAAASTWLRRLSERYSAHGLRLSADPSGNIAAAGAGGVTFTGTRPVLTGPVRGQVHVRTTGPLRAAVADQPMALGRARVSGHHILTLLGGRLLASGSAYPVTVVTAISPAGPGAAAAGSRSHTAAASPNATFPSPDTLKNPGYDEAQDVQGTGGCQGDKNWDSSSVTQLGIGYQAWSSCLGIYQAYYRFTVSGVSNSWTIDHIELNLSEVYSSWNGCSAPNEPVYLHSLGSGTPIGSGSDGANVSVLGSASGNDKVSVPPASNNISGSNCGNQKADFNVTSYGGSISGSTYWTWGVGGDNTDNPNGDGFMRLSDDPTMVITYDQTPPKPTIQQSSPTMQDNPATADSNHGCVTSSNANPTIPWIGAASSVTVNADFEPALTAEQVQPTWDIWNQAGTIVNTTQSDTSAGTHGYTISSPVDGDEYFMLVATSVDGNGQTYDNGLKSGNDQCSFALDQSPPAEPAISSTTFPPSGGTSVSTVTAPGGTGTFSFSAADPAPSGCASSHAIAAAGYSGSVSNCLASGVYEFEYSLNQPLASNITPLGSGGGNNCSAQSGAVPATNPTGNPTTVASANPSAMTTGTSCAVDITQWGTNILYVASVDTAGNVSQTYQYEFYVPWNPQTPATAGDVDNDGVPDLVATTSSGNLVVYRGGSDPGLGPITASLPSNAPGFASFGDPWNDFDVTHRGSWSAQNVDDLLALDKSNGNLYRYNNSGTPTGMFEDPTKVVTMNFPPCGLVADPDNASNCAGYPTSGWNAFNQILAPGDAWKGATGGTTSITQDSNQPSMLAVDKSTGGLWLFQGSGGQLTNPVQLGASGWQNVTLLSPGIVNGQNTLWARINSGTDAGDIVSFPLAIPAGHAPTLDSASPGTLLAPTSGTILVSSSGSAVSVPALTFPAVASAGPLTGGTCGSSDSTACPGVYAEDGSGALWFFAGQATTTASHALAGTSQLVAGVSNALFSWPLDEGSGTTASDTTGNGNSGSLNSGVSWAADPAQGNVPKFDGSTGAVTSAAGNAILSIRDGFSFTASAWIDVTSAPAGKWQDAVSQDGTTNSGFNLGYDPSGNWSFRRALTDTTNSTTADAISPAAAQTNTWTFLTGTYDAETGTLTLYVNGQPVATANDPAGFGTSGPTASGRGLFNGSKTDFLNGFVSQVKGFDYALNAGQVRALYNSSLLTQLS